MNRNELKYSLAVNGLKIRKKYVRDGKRITCLWISKTLFLDFKKEVARQNTKTTKLLAKWIDSFDLNTNYKLEEIDYSEYETTKVNGHHNSVVISLDHMYKLKSIQEHINVSRSGLLGVIIKLGVLGKL